MVKIFLDGTSSAGKSSTARELQARLGYKIVAVDDMTAEKWFPDVNKFSKSKTHVDHQNAYMAQMANKARNVIIDDITMEILPLLKNPVIKVLIYTNPMDLVRNVKRRAKKDFRYLQVVMQQFSEKYMAGSTTNHVDWISGHDIRKALEERKGEFVDQAQLNTYARQICDRLSIPYSEKKYYIRPVYCNYDIVINTKGLSTKVISSRIIQATAGIRGGGRSSKAPISRSPSTIIIIKDNPPKDVSVSNKKSGHRVSEKANVPVPPTKAPG